METEPLKPLAYRRNDSKKASQASKKIVASKLWRRLLLVACLPVLLLIGLFLLFAKTLEIDIVNALERPAYINITGGTNIKIGHRYLLLPGEYNLEIKASGFNDYQRNIKVTERLQRETIALQELPGILHIRLLPQGVVGNIELNGSIYEDVSEIIVPQLNKGAYTIKADANLYAAQTKDIDVIGLGNTQAVNIHLIANWGEANITSTPSQASVYSGEKLLGETPLKRRLEAGQHSLRIQKNGYQSQWLDIAITALSVNEVAEIKLTPADTELTITSTPSGAAVTLAGQFIGKTPIKTLIAPNETQSLKLFLLGYNIQERQINITGDQIIHVPLNAEEVNVRLNVSPKDAEIWVDGIKQPQGVRSLSLQTREYRIEARKPGYASKVQHYIPTPGARQFLNFQLLTTDQDYWSGIPKQYQTKAGHSMKLFNDDRMVYMGSERRQAGRRANEMPWQAHLTRAFYASLTEVTNAQFAQYDSSHTSGFFESSTLNEPQQPVVNISWQQAALYCNWLSEQENLSPFYKTQNGYVSDINIDALGYRLLTEAEWTAIGNGVSRYEKTPSIYGWGNTSEVKTGFENYADQAVAHWIKFVLDEVNDGFKVSAPVASFKPNSQGVYDHGGNVMEWVNDWFSASPYPMNSIQENPTGAEPDEFHVIKGASWARGHRPQLRLAYRDFSAKGRHDVGFRIGRYAEPISGNK